MSRNLKTSHSDQNADNFSDRSNHTGTQPVSTLSNPLDLPISTAAQTALDGKINSAEVKNQKPLYLIMGGQSNALGRATESGTLSKTPDPWVKIWNHTAEEWQTWDLSTNSTQILDELNGGLAPSNNAYNFAWVAAKKLAEEQGREVRVIVEAEGGDSIDNFVPDTENHWVRLQAQITASGIPEIDAFLWHQGETNKGDTWDAYETKLVGLIEQIKALSVWKSDTKILLGELLERGRADGSTTPFTGQQNAAIRRFHNRIPEVRVVPLSDLTGRTGDEVHFDAPSMILGGARYADCLTASLYERRSAPSVLDNYNPLFDFDSRYGVHTESNGVNVTYWHDRTAGNYAERHSIGGSPPRLELDPSTGLSVIDANNRGLQFWLDSVPQPFTVVGVVTFDGANIANENQVLLMAGGTNLFVLMAGGLNAGTGSLYLDAGSIQTSVSPPATDTPNTIVAVVDGASSKVYEGTTEVIAADAGSNALGDSNDKLYIGNSPSGISDSNMIIHRLAVIPRALTTSQVATINAALAVEHGF